MLIATYKVESKVAIKFQLTPQDHTRDYINDEKRYKRLHARPNHKQHILFTVDGCIERNKTEFCMKKDYVCVNRAR
jgi:hypothetical protein